MSGREDCSHFSVSFGVSAPHLSHGGCELLPQVCCRECAWPAVSDVNKSNPETLGLLFWWYWTVTEEATDVMPVDTQFWLDRTGDARVARPACMHGVWVHAHLSKAFDRTAVL